MKLVNIIQSECTYLATGVISNNEISISVAAGLASVFPLDVCS